MHVSPGNGSDCFNYQKVYDPTGGDGDPDGKIRAAGDKALDCCKDLAIKGQKKTMTVREGLQQCGWNPKTPSERVVDWAFTGPALQPAEQQELMMEFGTSPTYTWWGPDDAFVVDQHPRGYARALDEMVKDTVPPGDERLLFNKQVNKIAYDADGVKVTTADGAKYKASVAIVTLPVGVLLNSHKALFDPALPKDLAKIFDAGDMVMPSLDKIFIQFPEVFWDNSLYAFLAAPGEGELPGDLGKLRNLAHKDNVPGSKTLHFYVDGPEAAKYEDMDDAERARACRKSTH